MDEIGIWATDSNSLIVTMVMGIRLHMAQQHELPFTKADLVNITKAAILSKAEINIEP